MARSLVPAFLLAIALAFLSEARAEDTNSAASASSPDRPASSGGILKEIRDELNSTMAPYTPQRTLQDMDNRANKMAPISPQMNDIRRKQLQDNQQWIFKDLNELNNPPTPEDMFGLPKYTADGRDLNKMSPRERYFEELNMKRAAATNSYSESLSLTPNSAGLSSTDTLGPVWLSQPKGFGLTPTFPLSLGSTNGQKSAGTFGASQVRSPADLAAERAHQRKIQEFRHLLDPSLPAPLSQPSFAGPLDSLIHPSGSPILPSTPSQIVPPPTIPSTFNTGFSSPAANPGALATPVAAGPWGAPAASSYTRASLFPTQQQPVRKPVSADPFKDSTPKRAF